MLDDWNHDIKSLLDKVEQTCHLINREKIVHMDNWIMSFDVYYNKLFIFLNFSKKMIFFRSVGFWGFGVLGLR